MDTLERSKVPDMQMTALLGALTALKRGDSSVRLPEAWTGLSGKVAEAFNEVVELNERTAEELMRLRKTVGKEGKLRQRASLGDVRGFWKVTIDGVNELIDDLVHPTSETARVIGAVAQATYRRRWPWKSMTDRSKANSCARRRPSTRWSISWDRSRPK